MPPGIGYGKALARKAPKPDMMIALEAEPDEDEAGGPPDEDADDAVAMSAYEDFAKLAGFKPTPETFNAFREAVKAVK